MMQNNTIYKRKRAIYIIMSCVLGVLLIVSILSSLWLGMFWDSLDYLLMILAILGMLFAGILFISCCFNIQGNSPQGDILAAISVLLYFTLLFSGAVDVFAGNDIAKNTILTMQTITAVCSTAVHFLFWRYQCATLPKTRAQKYYSWCIYILIFCYLVTLAINPFTGILFTVDEFGNVISTGQVLEFIFLLLFYLIYLLYILPQKCSLKKKISLASFAVMPMLAIMLTAIWYAVGIKFTIQSITYLFLLMAAYVVFFGDYIESKEILLKQEKVLAEMRSEIMLSQLNPHFVANTLNSIVALCRFDPPEAERATRMFASYLRENYVDMAGSQMIPFIRELENLQNYIAIEQIRFPGLQVDYDISCTQFDIPTLTLQPLVENALTHGIHGKGKIKISACETYDSYMVLVSDNGVGYQQPKNDGHTHVGISNCRERLETLCNGSLTISGGSEGGTVCSIIIPKGGKINEYSMH